jgi:hypothetical protein
MEYSHNAKPPYQTVGVLRKTAANLPEMEQDGIRYTTMSSFDGINHMTYVCALTYGI